LSMAKSYVKGLRMQFSYGYFQNKDDAIALCRDICYSSVACQYWQYAQDGCWVEQPDRDYSARYPLTRSDAAPSTDVYAGEYIQHLCPPLPEYNEFMNGEEISGGSLIQWWRSWSITQRLTMVALCAFLLILCLLGVICCVRGCLSPEPRQPQRQISEQDQAPLLAPNRLVDGSISVDWRSPAQFAERSPYNSLATQLEGNQPLPITKVPIPSSSAFNSPGLSSFGVASSPFRFAIPPTQLRTPPVTMPMTVHPSVARAQGGMIRN